MFVLVTRDPRLSNIARTFGRERQLFTFVFSRDEMIDMIDFIGWDTASVRLESTNRTSQGDDSPALFTKMRSV